MLLSLCIPTNGIIEWIIPVIESIYKQHVSENLFEVCVSDNGNNAEFKDYIEAEIGLHTNLKYQRVECPIFLNEIKAYKMANGDLIKFVNHRTILLEGTLKKWISFMEYNIEDKPVVYFSNGALDKYYCAYYYNTFDDFINNLSYWSSASTGMSMWKKDIDEVEEKDCNELFPHTAILLKNHKDRNYIIDNNIYVKEINSDARKKGTYDLFYAFSVEYLTLLLDLYRNSDISINTFLKVKEDLLDFIIDLHRIFCIEKQACSYLLDGFQSNIQVFYSLGMIEKKKVEKLEYFNNKLKTNISNYNSSNDGIVIFGAGVTGRKYLENNKNINVICFIDNSVNKQHKMVMDIPILSFDEYKELNIKAQIIICANKKNQIEIKNLLEREEIKYSIYTDK